MISKTKIDKQIHYWAHMLDEAFNKEQFLCEDKEGKNINRAEKWIKQNHPEVIGKKLEDGTTITPRILTQEIRNTIPNVRMADCKFLVGATRLYFDGQSNPDEMQSQMNKLNKMLKIICTAHADEYDNDFNGLSFEELDKKFSGAVKKELDDDKEQIGKLQLIKNNEYSIIPIDSFDEAKKYGKYTTWCVTHGDDMYASYTKGGLGRFYFCLQKGFENVPKIEGEGCPMDAYGKSMIAISINDDGSLNTCTCRWNHANGGNDSMMDTKEISEFFGVDFYKTFKPYDANQLWEKLLKNQIPLEDLKKKERTFCETFKCIATYNSEEYSDDDDDTFKFKKLIDGKIITLPFIDATTTLINNEFVTLKDEQFVKITPKTISNMTGIAKGEFIIPDGVKTIGDLAFANCKDMTNVIIPNSVTKIGEAAFENCDNLTSVTIPDSVTSIGSNAFRECSSLTSVVIPDSVINVEKQAFSGCYNLINVKIGKGVSSISEDVFYRCQNLQSLQIAISNPFYKFVSGLLLTKNGKTLISCIKNDNVIIPDTVENISNSAFFGSKITNITIPDNVKSIGSDAFCYSNLKSVIIPDSVESIGSNAFLTGYRDILKTVYVKGSIDKVKSLYKWPEKTEFKQVDSLNEMKCNSIVYYWAHMLDEAFNKEQFLCEDKEGKNINRAEKWIKQNHPEVIGKKLEDGTTINPRILTQEIRNTVPNVRMADCKFLVGATRVYFDLQNDVHEFQSKMNKLNKMLKIICTAHVDEYDNNFNGLSFDELDKKFSGAVKKELDNDREEIGKLQLIKNAAYKIIPIDSFEEASKYAKYTSWCVTHYYDMYSNYTKNGLGRFYFCLQDGFENVPKVKGEGCPMDAYGKSMIAISVNDDGSLNTCTCRWNHDNGGNDSMMDTKEISRFFGTDFYKTFKPYDVDALWKKILAKQVPLEDLYYDDDAVKFCKAFDCVAIYANDGEDDDGSVDFKKLVDGKIITLSPVNATTTYINNRFVTMKDGQFVDVVPKTIQNMPSDIKGDIVIPYGVVSIENDAFYGCNGLTGITIPNNVTSIGDFAFSYCSRLTEVIIPNSVTSIGYMAFSNCSNLKSLVFRNKTLEEVKDMENYPWEIKDESIIKCEDK